MKKRIVVRWQDIRVYRNGEVCEPTPAVTEGVFVKETSRYLFINNPETLLFNPPRNHPQKKVRFCYIPKSLVTEIEIINEKK